MLRLFFKISRRIGYIIHGLQTKLFILRNNSLYSQRVSFGQRFTIGRFFSLVFDASNSSVKIGENVQFRDFCQIRSGENGKLIIGNNVFFNNSCTITSLYDIVIGDDCQFGENVKFYDANHVYKDASKLISEQGYSYGNITIGRNCWVGSNVCFLKNVTIGDNVVIGAGCTVYQSVPSNTVLINQQQLITKKLS